MPGQLRMFAQNIWMLLTGLVLLAVFAVCLLAAFVGLRYLWWRWRVKRAERRYRAALFRADGTPYPPRGEGLCQGCARVRTVYYLPDGRKLCSDCYVLVDPALTPLAPPDLPHSPT
jgi:hypothetical protein